MSAYGIADDVSRCHVEQFLNTPASFVSMDHKVLVTPTDSGFCIRKRGHGFRLGLI